MRFLARCFPSPVSSAPVPSRRTFSHASRDDSPRAVSRFRARFQEIQRESHPNSRSIIDIDVDVDGVNLPLVFPPPRSLLRPSCSRPPSHPPWISMNSKDNFATGKPPPSFSPLFPLPLDFCRLAFRYHPLSRPTPLSPQPSLPPAAAKIPFETDAVMQIRARIFINVILRRSETGPLPPGWSRGGA